MAAPYTQRSIEKRIKAARKAGLKVVAITPDGTVVTDDPDNPLAPTMLSNGAPFSRLTQGPKLRDAAELLK